MNKNKYAQVLCVIILLCMLSSIVIADYFGRKEDAGSFLEIANNNGLEKIAGIKITPSSSEYIESISAYLQNDNDAYDLNVTAYLYSWDAGNSRWDEVASTSEVQISKNEGSASWKTFSFSNKQYVTSGNDYVIAVYSEAPAGGTGAMWLGYSVSGVNTVYWSDTYGGNNYPTNPDPWTPATTDTTSELMMYASYNVNQSPVLSNPSPSDGSITPSITSQLSVTINDPEGDTFNWSIETLPNIGSNNANDENNGSKTCNVAGLVNGTMYTWYVNVTDGINTVNQTYSFYAYGTVEFWCYDESDPSTTIPFGIQISNQAGTDTYQNNSLISGDTISIEDLPSGDNVIFMVNSTGYKTRTYTYTISAVQDYNFSFYLPPEQDDETVKTTSKSVSNPSVNLDITLDCEPSIIVSVQGWNESLYGHWYEIPEDKYSTSGTTLTVDKSFLDDNTSLIKVTYYCDDEYAMQYLLDVYAPQGEYGYNPPINDAEIWIQKYMESTEEYENVSVLLTDGNGQADVFLIPDTLYIFIISKTGYITENARRSVTSGVRTLTFRLAVEGVEEDVEFPEYDEFWHDIIFTGNLSDGNLTVVFTDSTGQVTNTTIRAYSIYDDVETLLDTDTRTGDTDFTYTVSTNTSRHHRLRLWFSTSATYNATQPISILVYPVVDSWRDAAPFDLDARFEALFGDFELGYANTICILLAIIVLALFGPFQAGIGIISCGLTVIFIQGLFLVHTVNASVGMITLGVFVLLLGILYMGTTKTEEMV